MISSTWWVFSPAYLLALCSWTVSCNSWFELGWQCWYQTALGFPVTTHVDTRETTTNSNTEGSGIACQSDGTEWYCPKPHILFYKISPFAGDYTDGCPIVKTLHEFYSEEGTTKLEGPVQNIWMEPDPANQESPVRDPIDHESKVFKEPCQESGSHASRSMR